MSTGQSNTEKSRWELTQGRDPGAEADTEAIEEYCLQALLLMACSACLLTAPRITSPEAAPPTVSWASPINHQLRKCSIILATGNLVGCVFSNEVLSVQMTLAWSSWHKTSQHTNQNLYSLYGKRDKTNKQTKSLVTGLLMRWDKHIKIFRWMPC